MNGQKDFVGGLNLRALATALALLAFGAPLALQGCIVNSVGEGQECADTSECEPRNTPCTEYTCLNRACVPEVILANGVVDEDVRCQDWACDDGALVRSPNASDVSADTGCASYACVGLVEIETVKQPGDPCVLGNNPGTCNDDMRCVVTCTGQTQGECDDGNGCTVDSCDTFAEECVYEAAGIGLGCTDPSNAEAVVCDGAGACVQCNSIADCPAGSHECKDPVCAANACAENNVPDGTVSAVQNEQDCKEIQCITGVYADVADGSDLPDDSNVCTDDSCDGPDPKHDPIKDRTCGAGNQLVCNGGGMCVGCNSASDCDPANAFCLRAACNGINNCENIADNEGLPLPTQTSGDCRERRCSSGSPQQEIDPGDTPADNSQCEVGVCSTMGIPGQMPRPAEVACNENGGDKCDGNGNCVVCTSASDCNDITGQNDCQSMVCSSMGTCEIAPDPTDRPMNTDCTTYQCVGNMLDPMHHPNTTTCGNMQFCDGSGNCVGCNNPSQCTNDPGFCVSSTCMSKTCGTAPDPLDVPPDDGNECTIESCSMGPPGRFNSLMGSACSDGGTVCNGAGSCVQCNMAGDCPPSPSQCETAVCMGNACSTNFVSGGTSCTESGGTVCNGAGACVQCFSVGDCPIPPDCQTASCNAFTCETSDASLGTACSSNGGTVCDIMGMCVQCNVATDCPAPAECQVSACDNGNMCQETNAPNGTPCGTNGTLTCNGGNCN